MGLFNERHVRKGDKGDTMGISRDSLHKRRLTGGKQKPWRKKRKYELGRQPANTKLSSHVDVRTVRCRGGNKKFRALRLDHGNFSWGSENVTRKARILDVCYNSSNNELAHQDSGEGCRGCHRRRRVPLLVPAALRQEDRHQGEGRCQG